MLLALTRKLDWKPISPRSRRELKIKTIRDPVGPMCPISYINDEEKI